LAHVLAAVAAALGVLGVVSVCVLALRRIQVARADRTTREAEARLRPIALALVDGEPVAGELESRDALRVAALLSRYARWLNRDARRNAASFFEQLNAVDDAMLELRARRPWRRATAAFALGDMGSPRAVPALVASLDDPSRDVRAAATRSLGRLGAAEAVEPLVHALASGHLPHGVAGEALLAVGADALPSLRRLERESDATVRAAAVELVGLLGNASDAPLLVERLRDTSAEVRAKAARALGRLGAGDAASALRAGLDDRIPFVRAAAANALGIVGDEEAVPALLHIARTDRFEVARAAARALARIDPSRTRAAADESPHLREATDLLA